MRFNNLEEVKVRNSNVQDAIKHISDPEKVMILRNRVLQEIIPVALTAFKLPETAELLRQDVSEMNLEIAIKHSIENSHFADKSSNQMCVSLSWIRIIDKFTVNNIYNSVYYASMVMDNYSELDEPDLLLQLAEIAKNMD